MTLVLDPLTETDSTSVRVIDYTAWATFAADYMVRLYLAEHRWSFVQSHPLDLAAVALPALRVLRLVASIARVAALARRGLAERVMVTTTLVAVTVVIGAAVTVLDVERNAPDSNIVTFPGALWWAVTTVTTVGYGDRPDRRGVDMSNKKVLVLGGNFAGLTAALSVKQELGNDVDMTVVSS